MQLHNTQKCDTCLCNKRKVCMKCGNLQCDDRMLSDEVLVSLLGVYENEREHRLDVHWSQLYKFFYLSVLIMVLPNIVGYLHVSLPQIPIIVFRILGALISALSMVVSYSNHCRVKAIYMAHTKLIDMLPKRYRRDKLTESTNISFVHIPLSLFVSVVFFITSLVIDVILTFCK